MLVCSTYLLIALQFAPNNDNYAIKFAQFFVYCKIYFAICMYIVDFFEWVHIAFKYSAISI